MRNAHLLEPFLQFPQRARGRLIFAQFSLPIAGRNTHRNALLVYVDSGAAIVYVCQIVKAHSCRRLPARASAGFRCFAHSSLLVAATSGHAKKTASSSSSPPPGVSIP